MNKQTTSAMKQQQISSFLQEKSTESSSGVLFEQNQSTIKNNQQNQFLNSIPPKNFQTAHLEEGLVSEKNELISFDEILSWNPSHVSSWLKSVGLGIYEYIILENDISGDVLLCLSEQSLKELGVFKIGHRLAIIKAIFNLKKKADAPFFCGDFTPFDKKIDTSENEILKKMPGNSLNGFSNTNQISDELEFGHVPVNNNTMAIELINLSKFVESQSTTIENQNTIVNSLSCELIKLRQEITPLLYLKQQIVSLIKQNDISKINNNILVNEDILGDNKSSSFLYESTKKLNQSNIIYNPSLPNKSLVSSTALKSSKSLNALSIKPPSSETEISSYQVPNSTVSTPLPYVRIKVTGNRLAKHENESYKSLKVYKDDSCATILENALKKYNILEDWPNFALLYSISETEQCIGYEESVFSIYCDLIQHGQEPIFILNHIKKVRNLVLRAPQSSPAIQFNSSSTSEFNSVPSNSPGHLLNIKQNDLLFYPTPTGSAIIQNQGLHFEDSPLDKKYTGEKIQTLKKSTCNSGELDHGDKWAVAIYEYGAQRPDEISLVIGDEVTISKRCEGWFTVLKKSQQSGWVPAACLLEHKDTQIDPRLADGPVLGEAIWNYCRIGPNELKVTTGETIKVHKRFSHWLVAENASSVTGWIPSCYVSLSKRKNSIPLRPLPSPPTASFSPARPLVSSTVPLPLFIKTIPANIGIKQNQQIENDLSTTVESKKINTAKKLAKGMMMLTGQQKEEIQSRSNKINETSKTFTENIQSRLSSSSKNPKGKMSIDVHTANSIVKMEAPTQSLPNKLKKKLDNGNSNNVLNKALKSNSLSASEICQQIEFLENDFSNFLKSERNDENYLKNKPKKSSSEDNLQKSIPIVNKVNATSEEYPLTLLNQIEKIPLDMNYEYSHVLERLDDLKTRIKFNTSNAMNLIDHNHNHHQYNVNTTESFNNGEKTEKKE